MEFFVRGCGNSLGDIVQTAEVVQSVEQVLVLSGSELTYHFRERREFFFFFCLASADVFVKFVSPPGHCVLRSVDKDH